MVFLVDELDRCEPDEVLSTLKTMRAFLEARQAVFVVAADRDVVDQAISRLHAAPAEPTSAYYAGTGSILDKLFQIQVDVPPLRHGRLTDLATDLVSNRGGVWRRLGPEQTGEVVAILIPTHVESPRRVKVLLNAFTTAMRIAEDRHKADSAEAADPFDKHLTIAKLVCIQTEFPRFAEAVADDPLLLPALTAITVAKEAGEEVGPNADALAEFPQQTRSSALDFVAGKRSIEEDIHRENSSNGAATPDGSGETDSQRRRVTELVRYLYYTREVEDPTRDIVFGTSIGARYGLDPKVADQLEREALDGQSRRASELVASLEDDEDKKRAIRVLCDLVGATGMQARHAFAALVRTTQAVPEVDLTGLGQPLAEAVSRVATPSELPEQYILPVLRLTRWFPEGAREEHQGELLARSEWRESEQQVLDVLTTADHWTRSVQAESQELIVALVKSHTAQVLDALAGLHPRTVTALWSTPMWEQVVGEPSLTALTVAIASEDRSMAFAGLVNLARDGYADQVSDAYAALGGASDATEADSILALIGDGVAEPQMWLTWVSAFPGLPAEPSAQLSRSVNTVLGSLKSQTADRDLVEAWLDAVGRTGATPDESELALPAAEPVWPQNATTTAAQEQVSNSLAQCETLWPGLHSFTSSRRSAVEVLLSGTGTICDEACEFTANEVADLVRKADTPSKWMTEVIEKVRAIPEKRLPAARSLKLVGPLVVTAAERIDGYEIPQDLIDLSVQHVDGPGVTVLEGWLEHSSPSQKRSLEILGRIPDSWGRLDSAFGVHVTGLPNRTATRLVLAVLREYPVQAKILLRKVPPHAVVQKRIAEHYAKLIQESTNSQERSKACEAISAFELESPGARRVIIDAIGDSSKDNRSAATDFSRNLPRWVFDAPGGHTLLRRLKRFWRRSTLSCQDWNRATWTSRTPSPVNGKRTTTDGPAPAKDCSSLTRSSSQ